MVPLAEASDESVVALLRECFGPRKTLEQYRWKHAMSPWGRSAGPVAVDDGAVLGVRPVTVWAARWHGHELPVMRMMDGAVHPSARGRGVFTALVRRALAEVADPHALFLSTCVPASREAYRKLGWSVLEPVPRTVAPALPLRTAAAVACSPADLVEDAGSLPDDGRVRTAWDRASLSWRFDARSGHRYQAVRLVNADQASGVVFRLHRTRGLRVLVVVHGTGTGREQRDAADAPARAHRCGLLLASGDSGWLAGRPQRSATTAHVAVFGPAGSPPVAEALAHARAWRLTGAEIEGVL